VVGLLVLAAGIAAVGAMLPRAHKASRTLRVKRPPADVWPVVMQVTQASDVPVDVLDSQPPHRLVTRVTEKEKNFGGTWTIDLTPVGEGSTVTIAEDGWVANPIFRFVSRVVIGHHATMDGVLKQVAKRLNEEVVLVGE
jgi:uncharacterized protein YndB with AHSA1/START domain